MVLSKILMRSRHSQELSEAMPTHRAWRNMAIAKACSTESWWEPAKTSPPTLAGQKAATGYLTTLTSPHAGKSHAWTRRVHEDTCQSREDKEYAASLFHSTVHRRSETMVLYAEHARRGTKFNERLIPPNLPAGQVAQRKGLNVGLNTPICPVSS
ncbi:hypothetical protein BD413DRAFT_199685 [Trametes elegans]|nr:hypothetical protein BD413DRAFT_199685 [Trametes elegans]